MDTILNTARNVVGLSQDGMDFLVQALDPNHDFERRVVGYPDIESSKTVVQKIKKQYQLNAGAIGANWDCHIATLPELVAPYSTMQNSYTTVGTFDDNTSLITEGAGSLDGRFAPVVWNSVASGQPTFPNSSAWNPTGGFVNVASFNEYLTSPSRLVGWSLEVHDTTAEINKQGTVTTYRMPQEHQTGRVLYSGASLGAGHFADQFSVKSRMPPATVDEAMLYAGSVQWEAREGSYAVCTMNSLDQPIASHSHALRILERGTAIEYPGSTVNQSIVMTDSFIASGQAAPYSWPTKACHPLNWDTSGIYFVGLSASSTLTLTVTLIMETAPQNDPKLSVLAVPSPKLDYAALQAYSNVIRQLPPGVKARDNAAGDYFRKVLTLVRDFTPVVTRNFSDPRVQALGAAIQGAASLGLQVLPKKKNKKMSAESVARLAKVVGDGKKNIASQFGKKR